MVLSQKIEKQQIQAGFERSPSNKKKKYFVTPYRIKNSEKYLKDNNQNKQLMINSYTNEKLVNFKIEASNQTSSSQFYKPVMPYNNSLNDSQNQIKKGEKNQQFKISFHPETVLQLHLKESIEKSKQKIRNQYIDISNYQFRDEVTKLGQKPFITKFKPVQLYQIFDKDFDLFLRRNTYYQKNNTNLNDDPHHHSKLLDKEIKKTQKIHAACQRTCLNIRGLHLEPIKFI